MQRSGLQHRVDKRNRCSQSNRQRRGSRRRRNGRGGGGRDLGSSLGGSSRRDHFFFNSGVGVHSGAGLDGRGLRRSCLQRIHVALLGIREYVVGRDTGVKDASRVLAHQVLDSDHTRRHRANVIGTAVKNLLLGVRAALVVAWGALELVNLADLDRCAECLDRRRRRSGGFGSRGSLAAHEGGGDARNEINSFHEGER
ncbi:hypothetical protein H310_05783 [Aphanomyces invadans]|uniref:Uncharacterized protein n=1 Tax=Aphanomyces invadans TaxID=157072 RepID=A0A024U7L6_9STRA|nr:hypothetical protein H310_05783 [Aphanomyces invadans]ETW02220.1 hypothetical protein H310_05783 [Aphanomyces invadans]|eukprot:XP_008868825.1 hypothetical protein H310_05783 [Aphanomyces invadans]